MELLSFGEAPGVPSSGYSVMWLKPRGMAPVDDDGDRPVDGIGVRIPSKRSSAELPEDSPLCWLGQAGVPRER